MKRVLLALFCVISACAAPGANGPPPGAPHRFGATSSTDQPILWVGSLPSIPGLGNNGTGNVWDTTAGDTQTGRYFGLHRVLTGIRCDQTINLTCQIKRSGSSTWRTCPSQENTDGSVNTTSTVSAGGTTVTASVDYFVDFVVQGSEVRLRATNGATAPTTCEVEVGLLYARELGQ